MNIKSGYCHSMLKKLFAVMALFALEGCTADCNDTMVERLLSPDGKHEAVLFQRDCGATTGFTTQISVVVTGEEVSGSGNTFVADDDHGKARVGAWEGPWAEIKWLSANRVRIRYSRKSRIFNQSETVGPVKIVYQPI
jgi:hypothetical protein